MSRNGIRDELVNMGVDEGETSLAIESILTTIQPLQDLAKNWDIDISSSLEEYLHELNDINPVAVNSFKARIASENGYFDFAQAALVVQNSSHIYSRKVDFLHKLVYKQLEDLSAQAGNLNQSGKANNKRSKSTDADVVDFMNYDANQDFLPLDDILPIVDSRSNGRANAIDIVEDEIDDNRNTNFFDRRRSSILCSSTASATRLSLGVLNRTANLTNASSARKSLGNGNLAAHLAIIGSLDSCNCLRLVQGGSDIGENGILLIPGATPQTIELAVSDNYDRVEISLNHNQCDTIVESQQIDFGEYEDHDEGVGFHLEEQLGTKDDSREYRVSFTQNASLKWKDSQQNLENSSISKKAQPDFWKMLDPHSTDEASKPKPLRIGKTINLPPGIHNNPSDCVTGSSTKRTLRCETFNKLIQPQSMRASALSSFEATITRKRRLAEDSTLSDRIESLSEEENPLSVPLKGLIFGKEFAYIAIAIAKRQTTERRLQRKLVRDSDRNGDVSKERVKETEYAPENYDYDDDDYDGGFQLNDNHDSNPDLGTNDGYFSPKVTETNTGLISIDEIFGSSSDCYEADNFGSTFEELCRAHIKRFAQGAERYAAETKLSARVSDWQNRLHPVLEQEENRRVFNIHEYGINVINVMERSRQKRLSSSNVNDDVVHKKCEVFEDVCKGLPAYEVCRFFLASLSLCNSGNIAFQDVETRKDPSSSLYINLLKNEIDRPMDSYLAPSLSSTNE